MRKLLLTGGSHSELPLIEAAQNMGWYVITTGNNEDGVGHLKADKYVKGDFSDKEWVYELAKAEKVDAIVSGANDFAYLSTAYACEKLGLPGHDSYETARIIHIKDNFRDMTRRIGLKTPIINKCKSVEDVKLAIDNIGFPLLVKPVDLTGGKGVKVCFSEKEVVEAFEVAIEVTRESYVILEQFVEGTAHGLTSLVKNGKVVWHIVDNEQYGINKYLVLGACSPSDIPQCAEFTLINNIEKIANSCNLVDGLFHTQFILDKDNYPVMIDPCRRIPGDLYILLAKYTTDVDYPCEVVKSECGEQLQDTYSKSYNFVARECIMTDREGVIKDIHIDETVRKHIIYSFMNENIGVYVDDHMKYKAGILIMKFETYDDMTKILDSFSELVRIEFEED